MRVLQRFESKIKKTESCWLWTASVMGNGYGQFWNGVAHEGAHRFSYRLYKGKIPDNKVVMHSCDTPPCVNPQHLTLGAQVDNLRDMYKKGRHRKPESYHQQAGEKSWNAVLTNREAALVREEYARGEISMLRLANKLGISKRTVFNIVRGRTYVY